jgi:hypothetical protein
MTNSPRLKSLLDTVGSGIVRPDNSASSEQITQRAKLSVCDAAAYLNMSKSWLDKRRLDGNGPRYLKIGRRICYDLADLELFAGSQKRQHTSEPTSNS